MSVTLGVFSLLGWGKKVRVEKGKRQSCACNLRPRGWMEVATNRVVLLGSFW